MDVANKAQVEAGVDEVAARFGGVNILVSNAGIQHIAPLVDLSLTDWRKILAVHLDGAFLTTRACLRHMIRQGRRRHRPLHGFGPLGRGVAPEGAFRPRPNTA